LHLNKAMRNHYETEQDLNNEKYIAKVFESEWNCKFIKLNPTKYIVDYLIDYGDKYSWAEVKCANIYFGQYIFMISYKKIEAAKLLSETSGCDFFLIFKCKDAIAYHKWDFNKQYKFEYSGRTMTTRDDMDIEPVFRINPDDCKIIKHIF
tara:strand:- start:100 stop:549 length:450 start_codon:yes stop_codon:yes gene_type:complete